MDQPVPANSSAALVTECPNHAEIMSPLYMEAYCRSIEQPESFWGDLAEQLIDWDQPWERVLDDSNSPFTKWYVGGKLNACYNAVDRHILAKKGSKVALIHDSPTTNTIRHVTYNELFDKVSRLAGGMRKLGVKKGDRVVIYMPLIPEAIIAMLATARLGAVHSVVFGGFAASELCTRIEHAEPTVIIAANCGVEPHKIIYYLDILHEAVAMSRWKPRKNIIYRRSNILMSDLDETWDIAWESALDSPVDCVPVDANDPLYILYTSGTTDKPKGIQRPIGGHLVTLMYTMNTIYGIHPDDIWWNASDLGWVVGHSYICYGPLLYGATSVMYEGKPDRTPDPGQYFRIIDQHKVSAVFSVPTAFRVIRRVDPDATFGRKYSLKSLRTIFIAGEHCDLETMKWMRKTFKVPVLNQWWQTETGSAITATCVGFAQNLQTPPFTTGLPFCGYDIYVLDKNGHEAKPNELGRIAVKLPLPPGNMATLYRSDELFRKTYFQRFPGYYDTMDAGYKDENGYIFVTARDDDVINVAGHRISTSSLEDAILRHPDVADAAVFGVPEPTKGQIPLCLYVTKPNVVKPAAKMSVELINIIREVIGPIAAFKLAAQVQSLPRTRSGKQVLCVVFQCLTDNDNVWGRPFPPFQAKRCAKRWPIWRPTNTSPFRQRSRTRRSLSTSHEPCANSATQWPHPIPSCDKL
ncbi:acyl-CoA synthetase short-chain family member 3, mitochondrial isoform X1 [Anopheles aquasalis]|uniref:acyl-CoA synthetase short-chain family member 3, mitochondrial isoform X1 n=1 Tax=Anopheles aquasalis TaxID=42839 RepID=UPI00215B61BF|nr:acyl-CoA synthetase short-chain family member 3, mitochondrial isoform X1 [Anopheles aquasalis]